MSRRYIARQGPLLACLCHCMAEIVYVSAEDVWDGVTLSCGRRVCVPALEVAK